jgi:hypothetical protein
VTNQQYIGRHTRAAVLALLACGVAGCHGPSAYKAPVTKFRDSSSVVIESTKAYLIALNKTERDHYIYTQASQPAQIRLITISEVQVFDPQEIGARIRALDQLADYTDLLYSLATSDAPETAKARARDLGTALTGLSAEIANLSGTRNDGIKTAAGRAFPVIGEVLHAIVERTVEQALAKAIVAGDGPVNELIAAIRTDAIIAYERKRSALSDTRRAAVDAYNTEFEKPVRDPVKLKAAADLVAAVEDRWEAFQTARPIDGLEAMQRANTAMVKFAKLPKPSVTDFASFVDSMEAFASTAKRVGDAVRTLEGR